ncbi:QcrA and Rieske domain-containing protein [Planktothrix mougeotii]|uniref:Ubiquinol-cytochrome c reductase iron-sulfur subunit n=1 Tax=Planktothrix mougeotii LEGE 06226 TaxID=1828728 RepID=A0ABR9UMQ8_9CYAN|nr:ubiquinol-cytochrome c reductase iron-sulfur subunit [Planktothrix mougeotii]MBE9146834.1 ubiquinol-cytochrome c reductase iron-sulfur subunit [Planktothrix mougeotii LEGE 06226]
MNRRTFLAWVSVGSLASFFPMALAVCSEPKDTATFSTRPDGFIPVGTIQELDKKGSLLNSKIPALIIHNQKNSQDIFVVNPTCPHAGCVVKWKGNKEEFLCPCHGSQFTANGQLMKGPAHQGLKPYITKVEGNLILVKPS